MFKAGRQHFKDAAKRTSASARRVAASSREKYERVKDDAAELASQSARQAADFSRQQYERLKEEAAQVVKDVVMDPVIKFHGPSAHDAFVRWIRENPDGFVINSQSSIDFMLHRADCSNFVFHSQGYCLTTNMKVCSPRRERLERWARWQFFTDLHYCRNCEPWAE